MANYPPNAPPPGGYGGPPPGGYGPPPGGYGAPPPAPMGAAMVPQAPYGIDPITGMPFSDKSKIAAGLLQIFLGGLGVGRFYLGYVGIGIAQIAISIVTVGMLGWVWPFIDAILIFTGKVRDAQGRPLRD